jgi:hypothetical protein
VVEYDQQIMPFTSGVLVCLWHSQGLNTRRSRAALYATAVIIAFVGNATSCVFLFLISVDNCILSKPNVLRLSYGKFEELENLCVC